MTDPWAKCCPRSTGLATCKHSSPTGNGSQTHDLGAVFLRCDQVRAMLLPCRCVDDDRVGVRYVVCDRSTGDGGVSGFESDEPRFDDQRG
jgi:hypothetical protein